MTKRIFFFLCFIILLQGCSLLPQKPKINIEYSPGAVTVIAGEDKTVAATITPDEMLSSIVPVYVSENPDIVTVDYTQSTIIVHGKTPGITKVKSQVTGYNDFSFLVTVVDKTTVTDPAQKYITSSKTTISIDTGQDTTVTAQLINGTPVEQNELLWGFTNPDIFTITGAGSSAIVTPVASGNAEIIISHPSAVNTLTVYVKVNDAGSSITLSKTGLTLDVGGETQLKAIIPKASTAVLNAVTWATIPENQNMLTILGRGESVILMGNNPGPVTVMARAPAGAVAYCDVIVKEPKSLVLSPSILPLKAGDSGQITIAKTPANMLLIVNSTNPAVAGFVYDKDNNLITVTAVKVGTAAIQVTGGGLMAKTDCIVTQDKFFETDIQVINCQPSDTAAVHYSVLPADEKITWTVADPNTAAITVNTDTKTVNVNPIKEGTTVLTGKTASGITRTVNLNFWYNNLEPGYSMTIIGGNSQQAAIDNTKVSVAESKIYLGWFVQSKLIISFPQKGVRINNAVIWSKSADFRTDIVYQELDNGTQLLLKFDSKLKSGGVKSFYGNAGTLSCTINYSNNKSYTATFAVIYWLGGSPIKN